MVVIFLLSNKDNRQREVTDNDSMTGQQQTTNNDSISGQHQADNANGQPAVLTNTTSDNDRINLFAAENGGRILVASSDDWKYTIDGKEFLAQISYGLGREAVYGFKDGRSATFNLFTMLITATETFNVKEFELFAGNDTPMGQFKFIGKFQTQNVKLFTTPYQEFKFPPVTAKYIKIKLISTFDYPHPNIHEFQLFGILK